MGTTRVEIESLISTKAMDRWLEESRNYLELPINNLKRTTFYKIATDKLDDTQCENQMMERGNEVFFDPIIEKIHYQHFPVSMDNMEPHFVVEVGMKPGVTDNAGRAASEALSLLGISATVSCGHVYFLFGANLNIEHAEKLAANILANELIQSVNIQKYSDFKNNDRYKNVSLPKVVIEGNINTQEINLEVSDEELQKLNIDNCLALTLKEMYHLRDYYRDSEVKKSRKEIGLPENPTDVEVEVVAQTWSEHCKHKIFAGNIEYSEKNLNDQKEIGNKKIKGLYKSYIKASTRDIEKARGIDWLISVFSDNAGIVRFDKNIDLCIKAETHNSPSALDPYGGALTGILGVNRDILGCGLGARPIANTDVFCFAPPTMPEKDEKHLMPSGLKHPRRIFEGVHLGVEDGGNKSGIPTINGAIYFDKDYAGKPLVFCGTVGVMPQKLKGGISSAWKYPKPGDRVVMVGGEIGADGIHGATFSSLELDENSPRAAVQIGDPLTQKRTLDFLIEARDQGLYTCITDNGAGGLSSSVGEMAELTGGVEIDLARAPVKYPGLNPYELMISESQERMTVGVPESKWVEFSDLARRRGVDATDLGKFTDNGFLKIYYNGEVVANLNLDWLHGSLPSMELKAVWDGPRKRVTWNSLDRRKSLPEDKKIMIEGALLKLLSSPNIVSKEPWVRRYDHEVQASTHIKPFVGKECDGPSDSGVLWMGPHGGEKGSAVSVGCGINPRISLHDPYYMAQFAVDEAIRNVVVTGGDLDYLCLLDNFCWPDPIKSTKNPDGEYKLAQLVRACVGLYDICLSYGTPLVSGKDSMKNDFRGKSKSGDPLTISILPTLLVTAMAKVDIRYTTTSDFKQAGDLIYLIGETSTGLAGSELSEIYHVDEKLDSTLPAIDLDKNKALYYSYKKALEQNLIQSGHDVSDGGWPVALAESCIGGRMGARLTMDTENPLEDIFSEGPGRFVVSIKKENKDKFESLFKNINHRQLGEVNSGETVTLKTGELSLSWEIGELVQSFKREL